MNNLASIFLYIYVIITLFIGQSVMDFLGFSQTNDFISKIHFLSLPFLLLSFLITLKNQKFSLFEQLVFVFCLSISFFKIFVLKTKADFAILVNNFVEPLLLSLLLRNIKESVFRNIRIIILLAFILLCSIAIYESLSHSIIFAKDIEAIDFYGDVRAYSLFGHPLQNSFVVCVYMSMFSISKFYNKYQLGTLIVLGIFSLLAFNTRSSILLMGLFFLYIFCSTKLSLKSLIRYSVVGLLGLIVILVFLIPLLEQTGLGSRMSITMSADDGSANARYKLLYVFSMLKFEDYICGSDYIASIVNSLSVITIENSIIYMLLIFGIIGTVFYILFYYNLFFDNRFVLENKQRWAIFLLIFGLLNVNNSCVTNVPAIDVMVICLYSYFSPSVVRQKSLLITDNQKQIYNYD